MSGQRYTCAYQTCLLCYIELDRVHILCNLPCNICHYSRGNAVTSTNTYITHLLFVLLQTGKKLVFRSEPPAVKKKDTSGADKASREEEELAYFFT